MGHTHEEHSDEELPEDVALDAQQMLLEDCLELVFDVYDTALRERVPDPVVILLDCEDSIGGEIARGWLGQEVVDDVILEQQSAEPSDELTTVFAYAFPRAECAVEVPAVFPYLAPVFDEALPPGEFLAISVTAGGASALIVPLTARESLP
jgi:hypothetical protein